MNRKYLLMILLGIVVLALIIVFVFWKYFTPENNIDNARAGLTLEEKLAILGSASTSTIPESEKRKILGNGEASVASTLSEEEKLNILKGN